MVEGISGTRVGVIRNYARRKRELGQFGVGRIWVGYIAGSMRWKGGLHILLCIGCFGCLFFLPSFTYIPLILAFPWQFISEYSEDTVEYLEGSMGCTYCCEHGCFGGKYISLFSYIYP